MKLQFIGATHEVTGSCTLLELEGRYYLIDCGMEQGKDIFQNMTLPVPAGEIEGVFLTHAHVDHSGMLPKLVRDGFRGKIYSTDVTAELCKVMLQDSAHIQESEAQWQSKRAKRAGKPAVEPVYDTKDAQKTISAFVPCEYGKILNISDSLKVRFTDIGHLLGSAAIELWLKEGPVEKKLVCSGDVGNLNQRIIKDPQPVDRADYLMIESTYGNRLHAQERGDVVAELAEYIQTALDQGGNLIIPSFAVGRTQEMLYAIREIKQKGLVSGHPDFPVYVDSPLAVEATNIFMDCNPVCFDEEAYALISQGINPIAFDGLKMSITSQDSKAINSDTTPKVILSASGMCEAGRVRHHLKHNLWKSSTVVVFVGYQSEGSLGRKLLDGHKEVSLFGERISVRAKIRSLHGVSGHADQSGLLRWLSQFEEKPGQVFVNHGDDDACQAFTELLGEKGYKATAPYSGTVYDLATGTTVVETQGQPVKSGSPGENRSYQALLQEAESLVARIKKHPKATEQQISQLRKDIQALLRKWD